MSQLPDLESYGIVITTIKALGHSKETVTIDGGKAFYEAIKLSGELELTTGHLVLQPMPATVFGHSPQSEAHANEINNINTALRNYSKSYLKYWDQTAKLSEIGRLADAILMPVSPTPAPAPEKVQYFGEKKDFGYTYR
ncbi:uncharacterized protein N7482_009926 [Penicillium canariense]|uniref:Amidase n=1 Tax=Penicillium canariense TaxID=189055 RepID=A0A9W9HR15_9EURO|nr:uncharacterized protein N7482_009926 [Penicillium canariense]KAJ5153448.1 hypothetical protein N7482_009926 [Penicillium canariense]